MKLKKKISLDKLFIILGIISFIISMLGFIINACTSSNVTLAWILLGFIILGSGLFLVGVIMLIVQNKDKIKKYLEEIS